METLKFPLPPRSKCPSCMEPLSTANLVFFSNVGFCQRCTDGIESEYRHPAPIASTVLCAIQAAHLFIYRGLVYFCPRIAIAVPLNQATPAQMKALVKPEMLPNTLKLLQL